MTKPAPHEITTTTGIKEENTDSPVVAVKDDFKVKERVDIDGLPIYEPLPGERHFSWRAVGLGCCIGTLLSAMNVYVGNKIGWTFGGSLIAAILGYAIMKAFEDKENPFGALETNIAQTSGSAAGSMASAAGLVSSIPALNMLGVNLAWWEMVLWALCVSYLGVFFAVPLREQLIVKERLRFPTGTAAAETIKAMFASGEEAMRKAKVLSLWALGSGAISFGFYFFPALEHPALKVGIFATWHAWGFSLLLTPVMWGAGLLSGFRVCLSMLIGSIIAWVFAGPYAQNAGWVTGEIMAYKDGARGWVLWPGVAIMVGAAMTDLAFLTPTILRALNGIFALGKSAQQGDEDPYTIPTPYWVSGLIVATIGTTTIASTAFSIPPYMTVFAVALSSILAMIAVRSQGETDINPVGGMGKVTQLVFGAVRPEAMATDIALSTNLMCAGITGAGASQAGDMMQDLKTGYLLRARPIDQFRAQLVGIFAGVLSCVPVYLLFQAAYKDSGGVGGDELPSPAAHAWKAMAELLSKGLDALPAHAETGVLAGAILGVVLTLLTKLAPKDLKRFTPSAMSIGIAFIIPAYYSIAMFGGACALVVWQKVDKATASALTFAVASGIIAGDGLMGIVKAIMQLSGVPSFG